MVSTLSIMMKPNQVQLAIEVMNNIFLVLIKMKMNTTQWMVRLDLPVLNTLLSLKKKLLLDMKQKSLPEDLLLKLLLNVLLFMMNVDIMVMLFLYVKWKMILILI
jgi:hypothetical protein